MASHRHCRPVTVFVFLVALCFCLHSADASIFDTIRRKLVALTPSGGIEVPTAIPDQAVVEKKPKREGKRVAIIGMYLLL